MSEGLASHQGHFPVDDRACRYLLSVKARGEKTSLWRQEHKQRRVRPSTRADGQERTGRSTRLKKSSQFAGSGVRLARPACEIIQASVVEGIMACRDESKRLSPRHKDRSQGHFPITQKIQKFVEVPRVVQRDSNSQPSDLESDPENQKIVKIPQQTQRGQSPEGHNRPSVV